MANFEGLTVYLCKLMSYEVTMTFDEIVAISGVALPNSASLPQYWANEKAAPRGPNRAARKAGYRSFLLRGQGKVRFVKDER